MFRVHQKSLQRDVAVKALIFNDAIARERFVRESRATARIRHPGVVEIYGVESRDELTYLVMELIEGPTLAELIQQSGPLSPLVAARIAQQVAAGLQAAHSISLVHRDVKPANIMLRKDPSDEASDSLKIKLIDFGIVRDQSLEHLTVDRMIVGTPAYMSPEQFFSPEIVDHRCDVYGLGIVLYEMLTGTRPFSGQPHMIMRQVESRDAVPPCRIDDRIPRDLESVCLKAIHPQPEKRYQSAADLADDLQRFQQGFPTVARPVSGLERALRWSRRNPRLSATLGLALALSISLLVGSLAFALIVNAKNREIMQQKSRTVESQLAAVLDSEPSALPMAIDQLDVEDESVKIRLATAINASNNSLSRRVNAAISLSLMGEPQTEFLLANLDRLFVNPNVCQNLVTALENDPLAIERLRDSLSRCKDSTGPVAKRIILLAQLGEHAAWNEAAANRTDPTVATSVIHLFQDWHGDPVALAKSIRTSGNRTGDQLLFRAIAELNARSLRQFVAESLAEELNRWHELPHYGTYHDWHRAFSNLETSVGHSLGPNRQADRHSQLKVFAGGYRFVKIEPAVTWVGKFDKAKANTDVLPHRVSLSVPYWIADAEISVDQFAPFAVQELGFDSMEHWMAERGASRLLSPTGDHPVQTVSWFEAVRFCNWLSERHGRQKAYRKTEDTFEMEWNGEVVELPQYEIVEGSHGFRLLTDVQWEYASRRGSRTRYFFGSDESLFPLYGIASANRMIQGVKVRGLRPNYNGLYGMLGNVWEWTYDRYVELDDSPRVDPRGPSGYSANIGHVFHGGGIGTFSGAIDSESRGYAPPQFYSRNLGFRIGIEESARN